MIIKFIKKSLGPGDFPKKLIKEFSVEFADPYTDVINCSLRSGVFPDAYKKVEIIPIPKNNPPRVHRLFVKHSAQSAVVSAHGKVFLKT